MPYKPGLHILSTFKTENTNLLGASSGCRPFFESLVKEHGLQEVGNVYHDFDGGGFTAVLCLTESHLSIHTWPEFGLATFDVFLSNYQKENDGKVRDIYQQVLDFFQGETTHLQEVKR